MPPFRPGRFGSPLRVCSRTILPSFQTFLGTSEQTSGWRRGARFGDEAAQVPAVSMDDLVLPGKEIVDFFRFLADTLDRAASARSVHDGRYRCARTASSKVTGFSMARTLSSIPESCSRLLRPPRARLTTLIFVRSKYSANGSPQPRRFALLAVGIADNINGAVWDPARDQ